MSLPIVPDVIVDHVGIVCANVHVSVAHFRELGYLVSDPVSLMAEGTDGKMVPLGQDSAHIVFEDGYVELSAPWPNFGNHLDPYLAQGQGIRILCLRSYDLNTDAQRFVHLGLAASPVQHSSRAIRVDGLNKSAHFRWMAIRADFWPGTLVAVVQHLTPELVFAPSLARHANGARTLSQVIAGADAPAPGKLSSAFSCTGDGPRLALDTDIFSESLLGLILEGGQPAIKQEQGYYIRTLVGAQPERPRPKS